MSSRKLCAFPKLSDYLSIRYAFDDLLLLGQVNDIILATHVFPLECLERFQ